MTWHLCENLLATVHIWKWSFKTGNFVLLFTKQGGLWLGMTGGLSTQVKMNVKPIGAFKSGLIRQVVFERRGLKIQGPLYIYMCVQKKIVIERTRDLIYLKF